MEFKILGPLEVTERGRSLPLGGRKPRALLAMLLLRHGRVRSVDELIGGLWGDEAPAGAEHGLQVYVSELRKLLGGGEGITLTRREPDTSWRNPPTPSISITSSASANAGAPLWRRTSPPNPAPR